MKRTAAAVSLLTAAALMCLAGCTGAASPSTPGATTSPARQQTWNSASPGSWSRRPTSAPAGAPAR
ncbi:hypothetical protein ACIPIU_31960 [Streptomyces massasporeus]|uniref:hypothetical protein n=1 Tax=Streptomyces massasporeus TaxID=67324 RepID=UPI0037F50562